LNHVSVIRSVHHATGVANASELLSLLERVQPEVIFLELSPTDFGAWFDGRRSCLEATAAALYRHRHEVALVPVDVAPPAVEFARDVDYLFDRVEAANPNYVRLSHRNRQLVGFGGFAYLNSVDASTLWSAIQQEMRAAVESIAEGRLSGIYASWVRTQELREATMMNRVEAYARERPFCRGVLLVGLAHGQSIRERSQDLGGDGPNAVRWDFLDAGGP
jgi:hypothetical protein